MPPATPRTTPIKSRPIVSCPTFKEARPPHLTTANPSAISAIDMNTDAGRELFSNGSSALYKRAWTPLVHAVRIIRHPKSEIKAKGNPLKDKTRQVMPSARNARALIFSTTLGMLQDVINALPAKSSLLQKPRKPFFIYCNAPALVLSRKEGFVCFNCANACKVANHSTRLRICESDSWPYSIW
jgi:hypothetical protein